MRKLLSTATAAILLLLLAEPVIASDSTVDLLGRLPTVEEVALSPAGSHVALTSTAGGQHVVAVMSLVAGKPGGKVNLGDQKVRFIEWADEDHLMIITSATTVPIGTYGDNHEWFVLQVYDVPKQKSRPVDFQMRSMRTLNVIAGYPTVRHPNGGTAIFVKGVLAEGQHHPLLFRIDPDTLHTDVVATGIEWDTNWLVDGTGAVAAYVDYSDKDHSWSLHLHGSQGMTQVASGTSPIEFPSLVGFAADGASIVVKVPKDDGPVWRSLTVSDGNWGPAEGDGKLLGRVMIDRRSARIMGGVSGDTDGPLIFFDHKLQARWESIVHAFPDARVQLVSHADDFSKVIVLVNGPKEGLVYELVDLTANRADILFDKYEGFSAISAVRHITYAAADQTQISAFLTLPRGRAEKGLPLVVMPHGGPAERDTADFDWWAQALAAEGYAVLQPNYRGSDLGWSFMSAGFGQWGRKMQTDLSDGVRYLAAKGYIDPQRVCIVGASYGGYAALAGVTLDPGVYRCAVSVAGIADLRRMLIWSNDNSRFRNTLALRYWDRYMGVTGPGDSRVAEISPIDHLDAVTVPVLLVHGRDDTVVPYEQSSLMLEALQHAHKSVEMVTLKAEDHWLSRGETRLQMLKACVTFLEANNPPN